MPHKITTTEARSNFSEIVNRVAYGKERVLINRRGKPIVAVVSMDDIKLLEKIEDLIDIEQARKVLKESTGTVSWEKALEDL